MNITQAENTHFVGTVLDTTSILAETIEYIQSRYRPEHVFDYDELANWADENGFIKEE